MNGHGLPLAALCRLPVNFENETCVPAFVSLRLLPSNNILLAYVFKTVEAFEAQSKSFSCKRAIATYLRP